MQSPLAIGFLSIVPGMGFFVLGQPRRGITAFAIVVGLLLGRFLLPGQFWPGMFFQFATLAWVVQIVLAVQAASLQKKQSSGKSVAPREMMPPTAPPPGLSANERFAYKVHEMVRQQLNPGEYLMGAVAAQSMPTIGSHLLLGPAAAVTMRVYLIGATKTSLIVIEQDFLGKLADIKRIPLTEIKDGRLKKGLLMDTLTIDLGEKKPMSLQVSFRYRTQTKAILAMILIKGTE